MDDRQVIAGPILRRAEPKSISVWFALSSPAKVVVDVFAPRPDSTIVATGSAQTRRFAPNLHVVVVTAVSESSGFSANERHTYDARIEWTEGPAQSLDDLKLLSDDDGSLPKRRALGFDSDVPDPKQRRPSFIAPPADLDDLVLAHASCRRPGAGRLDALGGFAAHAAAAHPATGDDPRRPHLLVLTGDQIYADDVNIAFASQVERLADALVGTPATAGQLLPGLLPFGAKKGTPTSVRANAATLPALRRSRLIREAAKFTTTAAESHAITFHEYVAHHLLAWSPMPWTAAPEFGSLFAGIAQDPAGPDTAELTSWLTRPWFCGKYSVTKRELSDVSGSAGDERVEVSALDGEVVRPEEQLIKWWSDPTVNTSKAEGFRRSVKVVDHYADSAAAVAQLLANTPTLMIFDDHDVTDDWNLHRDWVETTRQTEWGRFILRNGLMAHVVCQAWGNNPAAYKPGTAGAKVLDLIEQCVGGPADSPAAAQLDKLLGIVPDDERVRFHFTLDWPTHQLVALDTRTWRRFESAKGAPNLVSNLTEQIPDGDRSRPMILVSAAPVLSPAVIERTAQPLGSSVVDLIRAHGAKPPHPALTKAGCNPLLETGAEKLDTEGWGLNDRGFEELVARLAKRKLTVVLSGDVHYASTMTMDYWKRNETVQSGSRIVQCTSSPSKNLFKELVELVVRSVALIQRATEIPVERLGWDDSPVSVTDIVPAGVPVPISRRARFRREPVLLPTSGWPEGSKLSPRHLPDWRWRIQPVTDVTTELGQGLAGERLGEHELESVDDEFACLVDIHSMMRSRTEAQCLPLRGMVFTPNVGEVTFDERAKTVTHRLWSGASRGMQLASHMSNRGDVSSLSANTAHVVPFSPTDSEHLPDIAERTP